MEAPPRVPIVGVPLTSGGIWCGRMEDDRGISIEDVCEDGMRNEEG